MFMFDNRDIIIFFAGAQAFHTLSHIALYLCVRFPMKLSFMTFTTTLNLWAIVINAVSTVALLWWASTL